MRTAVVGSRTFPLTQEQSDLMKEQNLENWAAVMKEGRELVESYVDRIASAGNSLVSGGARGVDSWAEERARELGLDVLILKPDWDKYGRGAGFRRNKQILEAAADVIAFWDLKSRGTEHTIKTAIKLHKPIIVLNPRGQIIFAASDGDWQDFESLKDSVKMAVPKE